MQQFVLNKIEAREEVALGIFSSSLLFSTLRRPLDLCLIQSLSLILVRSSLPERICISFHIQKRAADTRCAQE